MCTVRIYMHALYTKKGVDLYKVDVRSINRLPLTYNDFSSRFPLMINRHIPQSKTPRIFISFYP